MLLVPMSRRLKKSSVSCSPGHDSHSLASAVVLHRNFNSYKMAVNKLLLELTKNFVLIRSLEDLYLLIKKFRLIISGHPVLVRAEIHILAIVPISEINMVRIYYEIAFWGV